MLAATHDLAMASRRLAVPRRTQTVRFKPLVLALQMAKITVFG